MLNISLEKSQTPDKLTLTNLTFTLAMRNPQGCLWKGNCEAPSPQQPSSQKFPCSMFFKQFHVGWWDPEAFHVHSYRDGCGSHWGGGGMGRVAEEMATTIEVSFLNIPALSE